MYRNKTFIFTLVATIILTINAFSQTSSQVTPALEILSNLPKVRDFTMNSDGNEAYITIQSPNEEISAIAVLNKNGGKWQKPQLVSFSGKYKDMEASISPDGLTLFFVSDRPLDNTGKPKDFDIWYVKRSAVNSSWSEPVNLGLPVNTEKDEFYPSVANNGNLYFTLEQAGPNNRPDIMFSKWDGKNHAKPVSLGDAVNTDSHEYNSYISPDESFLIFGGYQRDDGFGSGDLYISFRNSDGTWKKAKNLGISINSKAMDYCPFVDWKTKTLYFTSRRSEVESNDFRSLNDFLKEVYKYQNGLSRIYKVSIADLIISK